MRRTIADPTSLALFLVSALCLLGFGLRIVYYDQPMRGDEAWTINAYVSQDLTQILTDYALPNNHILHSLLSHVAYVLLGNQPEWLRLPAVFGGVLMIAATFKAGTLLYNRRAGLLAAALVTTSSVLIEFSTNARGYTLLIVFFELQLIAAVFLHRRPAHRLWAAYTVFGILGLYTIPIMLYPYSMVTLWLALGLVRAPQPGRRRHVRALVLSVFATGLISGLLYLPAAIRMLVTPPPITDFAHMAPSTLAHILPTLPGRLAGIIRRAIRDLPLPLIVLFGAGLVGALAFDRRLTRYRPSLLYIIIALTAVYWVVQRVEIFARVWIFLVPIMAIAASGGVVAGLARLPLRRQTIDAAVVALAVLALGWNMLSVLSGKSILESRETSVFPEAAQVVRYLEQSQLADLSILAHEEAYATVLYYGRRDGLALPALATSLAGDAPDQLILVWNAREVDLEEAAQQMRVALEDYSPPEMLFEQGVARVARVTRSVGT